MASGTFFDSDQFKLYPVAMFVVCVFVYVAMEAMDKSGRSNLG